MTSVIELDTRLIDLIKQTANGSLTSHLQQEKYCRDKARRARIPTTKQEYTQNADTYKRLADANKRICNLIDNRIELGARFAAFASRPLPMFSLPPRPVLQRAQVAPSTRPLDIPESIDELDIPKQYICPITTQIMKDPVILTDGHVYERQAIEQWLRTHNTSPITKAIVCSDTLIPCFAIKSLIESFVRLSAL